MNQTSYIESNNKIESPTSLPSHKKHMTVVQEKKMR